jgi:hypothetical protein
MPSEKKPSTIQVAALAGRRPDAVDAETPRFPLANIDTVRADLRELFISRKLTDLVCAAACGADLLALEVANELGIQTHIILPFTPTAFRKISVVDRPGEWGSLYDRVVTGAKEQGHLRLLGYQTTDESAFSKTNQAIIDHAGRLAEASSVLAIVVWEGKSRGDDDSTQELATLAEQAGFHRIEVLTM